MKKLGIILTLIFLGLVGIHFLLAPSKNEFAEEDLLDEIRARKELRVGINIDAKPFGFVDKNENFAGYNVDLAKLLAEYIIPDSKKITIIPVNLSNRLIKASTGEVDMVISTVTITPQREEIVSFSIPYDYAGQAILVKANSKISSMADLAGENVGVIFGTTAEKNMPKLVPNANLIGFKSYNDAYNALKSNKISAITSDDTILSRYAISDSSIKLLPKRYSREPYGIAFKRGLSTTRFKELVNFAIRDLQEKNEIKKLHNRWGISE